MFFYSIIGVAVVIAIALALSRSSAQNTALSRAVAKAEKTGDVEPLVEAIRQKPSAKQPVEWDQALDTLWQRYARREAAIAIMAAAQQTDARIIQYWIRQVLEVEPEIANDVFDQAFIDEYFDPEVAAQCEKGCGC
jgi:hypothetical protein